MARDPSTLKVEVVGDASKLNKTLENSSQKMQRWGKNIGSHGRSLTKWVSGPIAGAIGGVAALAKKEGERADALLDAQAATGASTDTLQEYEFVASQAGVASDFFERASKSMARRLQSVDETAHGGNEAFEKLGIQVRDSGGELRSTSELTQEAMDKLAGMTNESERAALAQEIFKGEQKDVLAVVGQGADAIQRQREEAHELGAVQSNEALQGANEFRMGMEKLSAQFSGALSTIGGKFAPLLTDHVLPLFQDHLVPAIQGVADKVAGLVESFTNLSPKTQLIIVGIAGLVAALGPLLVVVGLVVSSIGTLLPLFAAIAGAISLPVVAIGALVAALIWAYTQSETFRNVVDAAFRFVHDVVVDQITAVRTFIEGFVAVVTALWQRWGDDLVAFATRTWNNIRQMIAGVLDVIVGLWETFAGLFTGDWDRMWRGIQQIASGVWNVITALWDQALNTIHNLGRIALEALQVLWQRMWTAIKDWASDRLDDVVGFVRELPGRALSALSIAWGAWQEFWRERWRAAANWALARFDDVVGWIANLPGRAKKAIAETWENLETWWKEKWKEASGFVSEQLGNAVDDHREFPGKAKGALSSAWGALKGFWEDEMRGIKDFASSMVDEIVAWFRNLPGRIGNVLSNLGSTIKNAFSFDLSIGGEAGGPGDGAMPPGGSVISRLNAFMDSTGIPHRTTSTFRPGDPGFHGMGRAVDFAGRVPGRNTPNLRAIQRAWVPLAASGQLKELIGPDASMNYKNGRQFPYSAGTQAAHANHVHTAMAGGGTIREHILGVGRSGRTYEFGEQGAEDVVPRRGGDGASLSELLAEQNRLLREQNRLLAQGHTHPVQIGDREVADAARRGMKRTAGRNATTGV